MIARPIPFGLLLLGLAGCGKLADERLLRVRGVRLEAGRMGADRGAGEPVRRRPTCRTPCGRRDARPPGHRTFFFDPAFSGDATRRTRSSATRRPRARQGARIEISCATCHDLARAGVDTTSVPGHVSVGAGWTDVNALPVVNSAYRQVVFWNGRADSLWALNAVVAESSTTHERQPPAHRAPDLRPLRGADFTNQSAERAPMSPQRALREHAACPVTANRTWMPRLPGGTFRTTRSTV